MSWVKKNFQVLNTSIENENMNIDHLKVICLHAFWTIADNLSTLVFGIIINIKNCSSSSKLQDNYTQEKIKKQNWLLLSSFASI